MKMEAVLHWKNILWKKVLYAANKNGKVNVHFTVSPEHRRLFENLVADKAAVYAKKYGVDHNVTFSEQKPLYGHYCCRYEQSAFP